MALFARRLPSLLRVPASPVPRSRRYYEGATTSRLRIYGRLLVRFRSPCDPPSFVSRRSAPGRSEVPPGPGPLLVPAAPVSGCLARGRKWDLSGLQAIRPVPLLRSGTPVEPTCPRHAGHVDAAPAGWTAKASAILDFGANTQLRHPLPYASRVTLPHTCKARFRLTGWPLPGGSRTHWTATRGFSSY
jgi:hypothetical protein